MVFLKIDFIVLSLHRLKYFFFRYIIKDRFLLVGKSVREKRSTGSTILGHHAFNNEANFHSVTSSCTLKSGMHNDTAIEVSIVVTKVSTYHPFFRL